MAKGWRMGWCEHHRAGPGHRGPCASSSRTSSEMSSRDVQRIPRNELPVGLALMLGTLWLLSTAFPAAAPCAPNPKPAQDAAQPAETCGQERLGTALAPGELRKCFSKTNVCSSHPAAVTSWHTHPARSPVKGSQEHRVSREGKFPSSHPCRGRNLKQTPVPSLPLTGVSGHKHSHRTQHTQRNLVLVLTESPGKFGKNPHCV